VKEVKIFGKNHIFTSRDIIIKNHKKLQAQKISLITDNLISTGIARRRLSAYTIFIIIIR